MSLLAFNVSNLQVDFIIRTFWHSASCSTAAFFFHFQLRAWAVIQAEISHSRQNSISVKKHCQHHCGHHLTMNARIRREQKIWFDHLKQHPGTLHTFPLSQHAFRMTLCFFTCRHVSSDDPARTSHHERVRPENKPELDANTKVICCG